MKNRKVAGKRKVNRLLSISDERLASEIAKTSGEFVISYDSQESKLPLKPLMLVQIGTANSLGLVRLVQQTVWGWRGQTKTASSMKIRKTFLQ